jgi:hypothetical protein
MKPGLVAILVAASALVVALYFVRPSQKAARDRNLSMAPAGVAGGVERAEPAQVRTKARRPGSSDSNAVAQEIVAQNPILQPPSPTKVAEADSGEESRRAAVSDRIDELYDMAAEKNPQDLQTILSELNNPESEIRDAARHAAAAFGSLEAIPKLEEAMAQTHDSAEKAELKESIEYLNLPSLSEVMGLAGSAPGTPERPATKK